MSLSLLVPWFPPNKTARVGLIQVRVKIALGEGLVPVTKGEDHVPIITNNESHTVLINALILLLFC